MGLITTLKTKKAEREGALAVVKAITDPVERKTAMREFRKKYPQGKAFLLATTLAGVAVVAISLYLTFNTFVVANQSDPLDVAGATPTEHEITIEGSDPNFGLGRAGDILTTEEIIELEKNKEHKDKGSENDNGETNKTSSTQSQSSMVREQTVGPKIPTLAYGYQEVSKEIVNNRSNNASSVWDFKSR